MKTTKRSSAKKEVIYIPRVIVKFQDMFQLPYEDEIERYLEKWGINEWYRLKEKYPNVAFQRLFDEQEPSAILKLVQRATELDKTYIPPNFLTYYSIECKEGIVPEEVVELLSGWKMVETVYIQSPPSRPAMPGDDPLFPTQGYLTAARIGIDAIYAWRTAEGAGVHFVDIEGGWQLDHEDLPASPRINLLSGLNIEDPAHGTAALGQVRAVDNALGCIGIAPQAMTSVISDWRTASLYSVARAILDAASRLNFGDVVLLEVQAADGTGRLFPVETQPAEFDIIRLATALGIVIIEPAGNGGNDLDTYLHPIRGQFLNRSNRATFRDSGALMVASAISAPPHRPMSPATASGAFTNYGSRMDCYAWGETITTLNADGTGARNLYRRNFGGTSGASAIIAGAAILVQDIAQRRLGYRFSPKQMRAILSAPENGTPSAAPATDRIGVMPNLRAIITRIMSITPDVYIRDYPGDMGDPHTVGNVFTSPDIIVRDSEVTSPQDTYGAGSGTENRDDLSVDPITNDTDQFIYVRVRNRGGEDGINVQATVYWSPPATLITSVWNEIGSTTIPNVPRGNLLTVSPTPIRWNRADIPLTGHYCFVCLIGNDKDPAPERANFANLDNFVRFIRTNNNAAWRNFNTQTRPSRPSEDGLELFDLPFLLTGAEDREALFDLEFLPMLPEGAEVHLRVPAYLIDVLTEGTPYQKLNRKNQTATLPIAPFGKHRLSDVLLPSKLHAACTLELRVPKKWLEKNNYSIAVRQLYENLEVGRITWNLTIKSCSDNG